MWLCSQSQKKHKTWSEYNICLNESAPQENYCEFHLVTQKKEELWYEGQSVIQIAVHKHRWVWFFQPMPVPWRGKTGVSTTPNVIPHHRYPQAKAHCSGDKRRGVCSNSPNWDHSAEQNPLSKSGLWMTLHHHRPLIITNPILLLLLPHALPPPAGSAARNWGAHASAENCLQGSTSLNCQQK